MAHSMNMMLIIVAATIAAAAASSCYDYTTYSTCSGKPCGSGNCYWKIYIGKRPADDEDIPQLEADSPQLESESAKIKNRDKRLECIDGECGPGDPTAECLCCTKTCTAPKILSQFSCQCVCPSTTCTGGKIFNYATCTCNCPPNSYWDSSVNHCVGECSWVSSTHCTNVKCNKNKHLNCLKYSSSCVCPSWHNVYPLSQSLCTQTVCTATNLLCKWKTYYSPYYYNTCSCY